MDKTYTDEEVDDWCSAVESLNAEVVTSVHSHSEIEHRVGMEMSGWGYRDAPMHVLRMISNAIEAGYAFALRDVADGRYDDDIRTWRGWD